MSPFLKVFVVLFLLSGGHAFSQDVTTAQSCVHKARTAAKPTVADWAEDRYDIKYLKFDLKVSNTSTYISGSVTTKAVVTASAMPTYFFELSPLLSIDSVLINGVKLVDGAMGFLRAVALPSPLSAGTAFTAQVFYHGTPVSGSATTGANGINSYASSTWGNRVTFTLSESYHAYEWWPCKQSLTDKIDSVDMWLTIPDSLKAGSNGTLQAITRIDGSHVRYEWKERYPIDYYLISLAVANYVDYSYYMHFTGSADSMLIQNYVYNNSATLPYFKSVIDSTGMMVNFLSSIYGRYPFWKEKYGHCMAPINGAMEHQTMTTIGSFDWTTVAHELGHQWFGDNVTCGTWADIFMNESFAAYTEYLCIDHFRGHSDALASIFDRQYKVLSQPGGAVYVDDTSFESRIFDPRLSYDKGACVLHMLRFVINDDTAFFSALKATQLHMQGTTATINDFKNETQAIVGTSVNGLDLDTFFNQWAYGEGFPVYRVRWNQSGSDIMILITQTTSMPSSVSLYTMPAEIKLVSAAGDTTIRIFNSQATQWYHFTWNKTMLGMYFDPNDWLLGLKNVRRDGTLDMHTVPLSALTIQPNPAASFWQVDGLPPLSTLTLCSLTGNVIWQQEQRSASVQVPAEKLPQGMYLLKVVSAGGAESFKVLKE